MPAPVSVVIPLYNHEKYIASTTFSVFSQTRPPSEIIIIDDGSQDGGPAIVRQLHQSHPEIVFWRQPNRGAHNTINSGVARATCEFVAILNSDDMFEPERIEVALHAFDADPGLDVVVTGISFIDGDGALIDNPWYEQALAFYQESGDLGLSLINANIFMTTSNLIVRRRMFDEIGLFANLRYAHDLDFLLRVVAEGRSIRYMSQPLLRYRIHAVNTISEGALKVKVEWAAVAAFHLSRLVQKQGAHALVPHLQVLTRHTLLEAVTVLLPYFLRNPSRTFERSVFHSDPDIQQLILEVLT